MKYYEKNVCLASTEWNTHKVVLRKVTKYYESNEYSTTFHVIHYTREVVGNFKTRWYEMESVIKDTLNDAAQDYMGFIQYLGDEIRRGTNAKG